MSTLVQVKESTEVAQPWSKLYDLMNGAEDVYHQMLGYVAIGASPQAAAAGIGVTVETMRRWIAKGRKANSGCYKQLYMDVCRCIGEASIVAENKLLEKYPDKWLRNGPRRWLGDDWRDDEPVKVETTTTDKITADITQDDIIQALIILRESGIDLNTLVDEDSTIELLSPEKPKDMSIDTFHEPTTSSPTLPLSQRLSNLLSD